MNQDDDDDIINVSGEAEIDDNNHNTTTYNESPRQPLYRNHKCLVLIAICSLVIIIIVAVSVPLTKDTRSNTSTNQAEVIGSGVSTPFPTTTTYPSQAPSTALKNWDLNYLGMDADFGKDSPHEIEVQYEMGINRQYEIELLAFDCESPITGMMNRPLNLVNITSKVDTIENDNEHELLTLQYDLDKSLLSSSNIWNTATNEVQLCQVVRLMYYPDNDETGEEDEPWIITQDKRTLNIYVDLSVGFTIGGDDDSSGGAGFGFEIELEPLGNATDDNNDREDGK